MVVVEREDLLEENRIKAVKISNLSLFDCANAGRKPSSCSIRSVILPICLLNDSGSGNSEKLKQLWFEDVKSGDEENVLTRTIKGVSILFLKSAHADQDLDSRIFIFLLLLLPLTCNNELHSSNVFSRRQQITSYSGQDPRRRPSSNHQVHPVLEEIRGNRAGKRKGEKVSWTSKVSEMVPCFNLFQVISLLKL